MIIASTSNGPREEGHLSQSKEVFIEPQKGPQAEFCKTPADIAIFGGAAGG